MPERGRERERGVRKRAWWQRQREGRKDEQKKSLDYELICEVSSEATPQLTGSLTRCGREEQARGRHEGMTGFTCLALIDVKM